MIRTAKFRLYPSRRQRSFFEKNLKVCCFTYNKLLESNIKTKEETSYPLSFYDMNRIITEMKNEYPEMREVHTRCLQNVSDRISKAYKNYYSRKKHGLNAGQPRFKKEKNYSSFTYNHDSAFRIEDERLRIGKLKDTIRIVNYDNIEGQMRTCTISKTNNKWYASITYQVYSF